jgi:hypothetical protein
MRVELELYFTWFVYFLKSALFTQMLWTTFISDYQLLFDIANDFYVLVNIVATLYFQTCYLFYFQDPCSAGWTLYDSHCYYYEAFSSLGWNAASVKHLTLNLLYSVYHALNFESYILSSLKDSRIKT